MENLFTSIKCRMQESENLFKKSHKNHDHTAAGLSRMEEVRCILEGAVIVVLFSYFFYRSYLAVLFLSPLCIFYRKYRKEQLMKLKKETLELQFKETILAVMTNLQAGYSMENAFVESYQDIVRIYGKDSAMAMELLIIRKGLKNGNTLEKLLMDLAGKCPDSEISEFAQVYSIASKTGSQWREVISKTVSLISQKIEIKEEIEILIHGKKTESRIMCIIPFFILLYMDITSRGYFDILYHNILGVLIMTACMAVYIAAYLLAEKVTEII